MEHNKTYDKLENSPSVDDQLKTIVQRLPESPGVYQYFDKQGVIIYVGKAKNLKRRVSSYFNKEHKNKKTKVLVKRIRDIKYIVVNSEQDALLLENNLIKEHKPRYNVLLKDDKTYPSICIQAEHFPRVFKTRNIIKNGSIYFGPYTHSNSINYMLDMIRKLYPIRTCNLNLSPSKIAENRYKVCLQYHIKKCLGPCVGYQKEGEYLESIEEIKEILKGNVRNISNKLKVKMLEASDEMEFEKAETYKQRIEILENYSSKSEVVSHTIHDIDVFSIISDEDKAAYINYLHINKGSITQAYTFEYKKRLDETDDQLLAMGIIEMRNRFKSESKEIVLSKPITIELEGIKITIPQKGDKRKLLDLSRLNVLQYKADKLKQAEKLNPAQKQIKVLKEIQDKLKLPTLPIHIESFDNSNIQGSNPVAACIVFRNGKPAKKEYRKYHIKTVNGPDDYASMYEIITRRYARLKEENSPLPNLIITDGGKGQMEVVRKALEELQVSIPIAGLAKDKKHRTSELLYGFPAITIGMQPNSPLFKLMETIQNEVHRFAITFHKNQRSKAQISSKFDTIEGVGPKAKELLLKQYKSFKRAKEAPLEDFIKLFGPKRGTNIWNNIKSK